MTDVLSQVVQEIAGEIRVQVTPQESERLEMARPVDPEVHDATLKGKVTLEHATREGEVNPAIELFHKTIDRDPTCAPAWAGRDEAMWDLAATNRSRGTGGFLTGRCGDRPSPISSVWKCWNGFRREAQATGTYNALLADYTIPRGLDRGEFTVCRLRPSGPILTPGGLESPAQEK